MSAFTPSGASGSTATVILSGASVPVVSNVSIVSANTEYSFLLPTNTKRFLLKVRGQASLKLSYASGQSGTTYVSLPSSGVYGEDSLSATAVTLYFQSPSPTQIVEIVSWT